MKRPCCGRGASRRWSTPRRSPANIAGSSGDGIRSAPDLASPLYFNIQADGALHCSYYDQAGNIHIAQSEATLDTGKWYYVAVTCDGAALKLWLADLDADTPLLAEVASVDVSASSDSDFAPWPDGDENAWSVFRGYWNHRHVDRFQGNIDEIRVSNRALNIATEGLVVSREKPRPATHWLFY